MPYKKHERVPVEQRGMRTVHQRIRTVLKELYTEEELAPLRALYGETQEWKGKLKAAQAEHDPDAVWNCAYLWATKMIEKCRLYTTMLSIKSDGVEAAVHVPIKEQQELLLQRDILIAQYDEAKQAKATPAGPMGAQMHEPLAVAHERRDRYIAARKLFMAEVGKINAQLKKFQPVQRIRRVDAAKIQMLMKAIAGWVEAAFPPRPKGHASWVTHSVLEHKLINPKDPADDRCRAFADRQRQGVLDGSG